MDWSLEAERDLWRVACTPGQHAAWLWWFVRLAWGVEFRRQDMGKWLAPDIHRPYCGWLQGHADTWLGRRRRGMQGKTHVMSILPRRSAKTLIATKCLPLALQVADPDLSCYIGSETHSKAQEFLRAIRHVLNGTDDKALFATLFGDWLEGAPVETRTEIIHAVRTTTARSEPSFGTFGVDMGFAGKHPDFVSFDDLLSAETLSEASIQAAKTSYDALYPALLGDAFVQVVGTRYADDDILAYLLQRDGVRSWAGMPCPNREFAPNDGLWDVYFLQGEHANGEPVMPTIWPAEEMRHYKRTRPMDFASQVQNDPSLGAHQPLTRDYIDETLLVDRASMRQPFAENFLFASIHVDTAFKDQSEGSDYNAIVTWLHDVEIHQTGTVYLQAVRTDKVDAAGRETGKGGTWTQAQFDQQLIEAFAECKRLGVRVAFLTDEKSTGGRGDAQFLRHLLDVLRPLHVTTRVIFLTRQEGAMGAGVAGPANKRMSRGKFRRINRAATNWLLGYVRLFRDAKNRGVLENEMLKIGQVLHEDVSDAAADVFASDLVWRPPSDPHPGMTPGTSRPGDELLRGVRWTVGDFLRASPTRRLKGPEDDRTVWGNPRKGIGWEEGF